MGPTVVLRSRSSQVLGAAMVAIGVAGVLAMLAAGTDALLTNAAPFGLFGLAGWSAFWRPCVEVSDGGIRIVNTLRTVQVPWPALREVQGRYGLRLETAYGAVRAWGAQPPTGKRRARRLDSEVATTVRERWERLQAAGHLDGPVLERSGLQVSWHRGVLVAMAALLVATAALPAVRVAIG